MIKVTKWMSTLASARMILLCNIMLYIGLPVYFVYKIMGSPSTGIDDAIIFFIYARNFAQGHGIVYNVGGEHVEGVSSLLYFLICSVFYRLSNHPEKIIFAYNFLIVVVSSVLMIQMLKTVCEKANTSSFYRYIMYWIYFAWLLMSPFYYSWTVVSLMDVATYSFLLIAAYCYFVSLLFSAQDPKKQSIIVSILIGLILICRPEGMLWGCVYLFNYYLISYQQKQNFVEAIKQISLPALSYLVILISLTLFRLAYFGYALPNTYYAKVSSSLESTLTDGLNYFLSYIDLHGFTIFIPTALLGLWVAFCFFGKKKKNTHYYLSVVTLSFVLCGFVIPIIEGGDHFNGFRLFQSSYPLSIVPFILLLIIFHQKMLVKLTCVLLLSFSFLLLHFDKAGWSAFQNSNTPGVSIKDARMRSALEYQIAQIGLESGARLNDIFKGELPSIGYAAAGGIGYAYDGFFYDVLGLNSTQFAHADTIKEGYKGHQSFNKRVLLELAPDIFIPLTALSSDPINLLQLSNSFTNRETWDNLVFKNIFNDPAFRSKYILASVYNTQHPTYQCYGYFNKTYLAKISQNKDFRIQTN